MHFLERVDEVTRLTDIVSHGVWDELIHHFLKLTACHGPGDNVNHLLTDVLDLCVLGVGCLAGLAGHLLSEADTEHTQDVAVGGLDVCVGFDAGLRGVGVGLDLFVCCCDIYL